MWKVFSCFLYAMAVMWLVTPCTVLSASTGTSCKYIPSIFYCKKNFQLLNKILLVHFSMRSSALKKKIPNNTDKEYFFSYDPKNNFDYNFITAILLYEWNSDFYKHTFSFHALYYSKELKEACKVNSSIKTRSFILLKSFLIYLNFVFVSLLKKFWFKIFNTGYHQALQKQLLLFLDGD